MPTTSATASACCIELAVGRACEEVQAAVLTQQRISLLHNLHKFHNPNIASAFKTYEKKLQADIDASIPDSKD